MAQQQVFLKEYLPCRIEHETVLEKDRIECRRNLDILKTVLW